jgi:hypothetical protein
MKPCRAVLTLALLAGQAMAPASPGDAPDALTPDGGRYYGELREGRLHGRGRLDWPTGSSYEGEFRDGLMWGRGEARYRNGRSYVGEFVRGTFEGKGRFAYPEGDVYDGEYKSGEIITGRYERKDGARYEGGFRDWKFHGPGRYTDAQGITYEGTFTDGSLQGTGKVSGKGTVYEGELKYWQPSGKGVLRHANGDVYQGSFEHGMYEGQGTLKYAKPQSDGRTEDSGVWKFGQLPSRDDRSKQLAHLESALYGQKALLDQALASLKPGRAGKIDLYLLTVAGDGSQEVFRREVEFVQKAFAERFGTEGRALALINSRNTLSSAPMATMTSIRAALQAMAARMDREEDILFMFLTSHGSPDHQLTLDQVGMDLRALPAAELGRLLRESGIRWKVVVVSACYSGGFVDALQDGHTLVITAARRDRTSFGCADENDFTYFGRAFFKEALPEAQSFQQAFKKAATLVSEWEAKDHAGTAKAAGNWAGPTTEVSHSLPQIHSPAAIEAHLQRWWAQPR